MSRADGECGTFATAKRHTSRRQPKRANLQTSKGEEKMTNRFIKFAAAVAPAALLLAVGATPANAKVLLMGDGGWEVSFDGSVNGFAVWSNDEPPVTNTVVSGVSEGHSGGIIDTGVDTRHSFRVRTGLLPAVWGMNVKAPTTGGLDMAARIGIYPNISDNNKNSFGSTVNSQLDLREIFFTVDGSWGQALVGKTLSQFLGKNILTDMTLFGVGGVGLVKQAGGTTLGRIGTGYVYPQFNARLQYTTPDMSGFKVSVGAYDPSDIKGGSSGNIVAKETSTPKFEGEASYAGSIAGANVLGWISGMDQNANFVTGCGLAAGCTGDVTSWGFAGGVQVGVPVGPGTLTLMGSGYTGEGLGLDFQQDALLEAGGIDNLGNARRDDGFIGQIQYGFGQGTTIGGSYGESSQDETSNDTTRRLAHTNVEIERQSLWDAMVSHDINPNLKLVAEYGRENVRWHDGQDVGGDIYSVGAFFFW